MDDHADNLARRAASAALTALLGLLVLLLAAAPAAAATVRLASTMLKEPVYRGPAAGSAGPLGLRAAPDPGSGGWYWPIGTEDFKGWAGWLDPRGAYVHVAQDMPCAAGHDVYAIGDGVVYISRADAGGYGVGGAPGGCIIITHATATGTRFHALYGHVASLRVKTGQRVTAGQVIARVNGCRHLHFSTHPGTKYRDGNPYAGHVPKSWADRGGFVDPVRFLRANPRVVTYAPPALPWSDVPTATAPLRYGAADGNAYWTEEGAAGAVTWRLHLATGVRSALPPDEVAPPFDARRYEVAALTAPALGFSVGDRLPVATLTAKHATPAWGAQARLVATLANTAGAPLRGAILKLQRYRAGGWETVRLAVTDAQGAASFVRRTGAAVALRVAFAPPARQPEGRAYLGARSVPQTITPHVALTGPRVPAEAAADAPITVTGGLVPHHPAGDRTVRLVFQRRDETGAWVTGLETAAVNRDAAGGDATMYLRRVRLTAGSWRVRAIHPADEEHALTTTAWRGFAVR